MRWQIIIILPGLCALLHDDELIAVGNDPTALLAAYGMFTGRSEHALVS